MKEDLLTNLPQEMMREILGRLPIRSIMRCKCVCKSWRHLIEGGDFATSYTPKPGVAFADRNQGYTVCDEAFEPLFRFGLPPPHNQYLANIHRSRLVICSANGLLLVWAGFGDIPQIVFVCNPMTREYIVLPRLPTTWSIHGHGSVYGFGVSRLSGQYKILCGDQFMSCYVYTLGRGGGQGLWRSISPETGGFPTKPYDHHAVFLNGNLHWLAYDFKETLLLCCFDLETEIFTKISLPPRDGGYRRLLHPLYRLCILEDRLCLSDVVSGGDVVIWRMNNYGDTDSWVKEYSFPRRRGVREIYLPLKVLANGDLSFTASRRCQQYIYSKDTGAIKPYCPYCPVRYCDHRYYSNMAVYTPSFLSLTAMGVDNVQSLTSLLTPTTIGIDNAQSSSFY